MTSSSIHLYALATQTQAASLTWTTELAYYLMPPEAWPQAWAGAGSQE